MGSIDYRPHKPKGYYDEEFEKKVLDHEIEIVYYDNPELDMKLKFKDFLDFLYDLSWKARAFNAGQDSEDYHGILEVMGELYKGIRLPFYKKAIPTKIMLHGPKSRYEDAVEVEFISDEDYSVEIDIMCRMIDEIEEELDSVDFGTSLLRFFGKEHKPRFDINNAISTAKEEKEKMDLSKALDKI